MRQDVTDEIVEEGALEDEAMPPAPARTPRKGLRAILGAAVAIVGVIAAANPASPVLRALNAAMPALADAIPTIVTACGAIVAAYSAPPELPRFSRSVRNGR